MTKKTDDNTKLEQFSLMLKDQENEIASIEEYLVRNYIRFNVTDLNTLSQQQLVPKIDTSLDADVVFEVKFDIQKRFWIFFKTELLVIYRLFFKQNILIDVEYIAHEKEPL